ncbi:hypothetical protein LXA43DRAFT_1092987 [Ganoderma leucocontextum]|nr:hypothetical protein LXA43DRAFT_1092987 [Ganoderma leucocontextum]
MAEDLQSLINESTKIKVSSTLDKSVGKKHLIDHSPETCWTSQQGTPQYIQLTFSTAVIPKRIELTFQGGFAGTRTSDVNRKQVFDWMVAEADLVDAKVESMRLVFEESSDFFGRITVYDLQILGSVPA